jgi:PAS domain S-box-containing protein
MKNADSKDSSQRASALVGWRRLIAPPQHEDPVESERAVVLHRMVLWQLALAVLAGPFLALQSPQPTSAFGILAGTVLLLVAGLYSLQRSARVAGPLVTLVIWGVATTLMVSQGVARGAVVFPVVVVFAALFWDPWAAVGVGLLSAVTVFTGAELDMRGWLGTRPGPHPELAAALDITILMMVLLSLCAAGLQGLRRVEARWRREARRHRDIIARSPEGIFFMDAEGRIESFNPAAEELTGLVAARVVGEFLWELNLVHGSDESTARRVFRQVFDGSRREGLFEVEVRGAEQELIPIEVHALRVRRPEGGHGIMATCRDLRERREGEAERAELEEMLNRARRLESVGRLAGGVAHDFNNLLTVMLTNTELLLAEKRPGPHWRDDVQQIRSAAKRASDLTQQLLAFARRETLEPRVLNLNEPLLGLRDLLEKLCGESIAVHYELGDQIPPVLLDRARLEQVVMNLAANSRDAMLMGGRLTIRSSSLEVSAGSDGTLRGMAPGEYAWLRVEDDGAGMDEDTVAHIFEPFFSTKREQGGTGLGLATVHGIVGQSEGFVFVESCPGEGTAFDIFFPATGQPAESDDTPPLVWGSKEASGGITILFVEDEAVVGRITQRVLSERGYEVLWAQGVEDAKSAWSERKDDIDLLLSDVVMPDGFGPELARELRAERPELRVLYISGYDDGALGPPLAAEESGFTLVRKPVSIDRLVENVEDALNSDPTPPGGQVSSDRGPIVER